MIKSRLPILILSAFLLLVAAGTGWTGRQRLPAGAAAQINGQVLTQAQYDTELRLKAMRNALAGRGDETVNEPALLNRIIGDMLVLEAAREADFSVDQGRVDQEIGTILRRLQLAPAEMELLLQDYALSWADFERSVHDYLLLSRYVDEVILAGAPPAERQNRYADWLAGRYAGAEMRFDDQFLDEVNGDVIGDPFGNLSG